MVNKANCGLYEKLDKLAESLYICPACNGLLERFELVSDDLKPKGEWWYRRVGIGSCPCDHIGNNTPVKAKK